MTCPEQASPETESGLVVAWVCVVEWGVELGDCLKGMGFLFQVMKMF